MIVLRGSPGALALAAAAIFGCERPPEPSVRARADSAALAPAEDATAAAAGDASPTEPPAVPTDVADLELVGELSVQPAARRNEALRAARELISWARTCAESLADGATFRATLSFEGNTIARSSATVTSGARTREANSVETCVQSSASALSLGSRGLRATTEFTAEYRVVRRAPSALSDPARRCERDQDCRLTTGTCTGPAPLHVVHAATRGAINARALVDRPCGQSNVTPSQPRCDRGLCVAHALAQPQWRSCDRTQECVVLVANAEASPTFTAVNRGSLARALQILPNTRAALARDRPPTVSCEYHFCAVGWQAPDPNAILPRPAR
jgi:hypothetical protein